MLHFGAPQLIIIVIYAMGLGITITKHNEPREGKYNFWATLICTIISLSILAWGGFFTI